MNVTDIRKLLDKSYSAFHVVKNIKEELEKRGFIALDEKKPFDLKSGNSYYVTRNDSSIIAFTVPSPLYRIRYKVTASHTDSPTFKVKPNPVLRFANTIRLNTEPYGGGILGSWIDRPLSLAGRVMVQNGKGLKTRLLALDRDFAIIPSLAIHMDRNVNQGHAYNASKDTLPLIGLWDDPENEFDFKAFLAKELGLTRKENVFAYDLFLYNRMPTSLIGKDEEFLASGRLDDLASCYSSLFGFMDSHCNDAISVFAAFDNEEVGSLTRQGANSTFLKDILSRIAKVFGKDGDGYEQAVASSMLVSIDNAHAVHPNYPEFMDKTSPVNLGQGIVIKYNANQSYTSDGFSASVVEKLCLDNHLPFQSFTNRSDLRGGSTLGNISNSEVSLTSVDIGIPQLAMHSSYEMLAVKDLLDMGRFVQTFYDTPVSFDDNTIHIG